MNRELTLTETFMKIETGDKIPCTVLCNFLFANECISLGVIGFFLHHICFKSFLQTWMKAMPQCIPKPLTSRNEKTLAEKFSASESVFSSHYWEIPLQKHQGQRKKKHWENEVFPLLFSVSAILFRIHQKHFQKADWVLQVENVLIIFMGRGMAVDGLSCG